MFVFLGPVAVQSAETIDRVLNMKIGRIVKT